MSLIDASRRVEQSLKNELIAHLQRLPIGWFDRSRTGDLTSRMTQDVELVRFVMGPLLLHGGSTLCLLPGRPRADAVDGRAGHSDQPSLHSA